MSFRFLHSADLHIAKPFGNLPEDIRHRLREARHGVIARLAEAARQGGASHVLLAGDTFDVPTPSPQVVRHVLRAMAAAPDLQWIVLTGNHDPLSATELWDRMRRDKPGNVTLALEAAPIEIPTDGDAKAVILPAPPTTKRPGRDLTEWMTEAATGEALRIGLAHGAIQDFDNDVPSSDLIPPNRADLSDLDYLALGDWHGQLKLSPRAWYSGSPEADSFKHETLASALLVELRGRKAVPDVTPVQTGTLSWQAPRLDLRPGDDPGTLLASILPAIETRRDTLLQVQLSGRLSLAARSGLQRALDAVRDDFGYFEADLAPLGIEQSASDLDEIDQAGALRQAAERLRDMSLDEAAGDAKRDVAAAALSRLYGYAMEVK